MAGRLIVSVLAVQAWRQSAGVAVHRKLFLLQNERNYMAIIRDIL